MNYRNENKEIEKLMEGFYGYVGYYDAENTAKTFDQIKEAASKIEYPKELDDWFYGYLEKSKKAQKKKQRSMQLRMLSRRVAMIFFVIGISMMVMTFVVEAFRIKFLNLITNVAERYTSVQVGELDNGENGPIPAQWAAYYLPEYVPDGYRLSNTQTFDENKIINYRNDNREEIQFSQSPNNNNFQIDTEGAEVTEVIINSDNGILITKDGLITLLWHNQENVFYIIGKLDKEEVLRMAESTKIKKE